MSSDKRYQNIFFLTLIVCALVLAFFILRPFISAIFLGVIFAIVFNPLYQRLLRFLKGYAWFASLFSTVFILAVVLLPLAFLGFILFREFGELYNQIMSQGGGVPIIETVMTYLKNRFHIVQIQNVDIEVYIRQTLNWIMGNMDVLFSNSLKIFTDFIVLTFTLFYSFKDGKKLREKIVFLSPLPDVYDRQIFAKIELAINSIIRGFIFVWIIQGLSAMIGFYIFHVPNPILWGTLAGFAAMIPVFGTALVTVPAIVYLFFNSSTLMTAGLLAYTIIIIQSVDGVLAPFFIEKGIKIHPFLILISIFGGLIFFGPIGFFAGPVALSILIVLLDIYPLLMGGNKLKTIAAESELKK